MLMDASSPVSTGSIISPGAAWIWLPGATAQPNAFGCFRRTMDVSGQARPARLRITADSRYELYVNGEWVGQGPARSWMSPWPVDEYDLSGLLHHGVNVIAVLVQSIGLSTFQYLAAEPGLLVDLAWSDHNGEHAVQSDGTWRCCRHEGYAWPAPRISIQQAWEEQFDACREPGPEWMLLRFDDSTWQPARSVRGVGAPPHEALEMRDIPMLTRDPVEPASVLAVEAVRPARWTWSINLRSVINPDDLSANMVRCRLLLATFIHSDRMQEIQLHDPHCGREMAWKLNGVALDFSDNSLQNTDRGVAHGRLFPGWNVLMGRLHDTVHACYPVLNVWTAVQVEWAASPGGPECDNPWIVLGPFAGETDVHAAGWFSRELVLPASVEAEATSALFEEIWGQTDLDAEDVKAPYVHPLPDIALSPVDVYAIGASERRVPVLPDVEEPAALTHDNANWTVIHPMAGVDVRLLIDFGNERLGYHEMVLDAPAGTIVDVHNFEFIQRDGRINLAEGMNNSFRYVCRQGVQTYRTFVRRGFRYSWVSLRHFNQPVRIRQIRALISAYPPVRQGSFACSDPMLDRIWEVGAHSVRCCAEDTFVDCPTYEQTHWVGDARNEALVDLVANGDPRLSRHCWIQAGRSLSRSPLVESHVPSGWQCILPAWSFLWMRWAREHFHLTGDASFVQDAMPLLEANAVGIREHLTPEGLFRIHGWNMFDWAPMDTPSDGIVTHQNCLAVMGLRETAGLARETGNSDLAQAWDALADRIATAVNTHLWSDERQAYLDCLRADGSPSPVFSQQTQTAAYISGVAKGARAEICRAIVDAAPAGFVTAGSPFYMFFVLEALVRQGRFTELLEQIRSYWGVQIAAGATTFWEQYYQPAAGTGPINGASAHRLTRSHCHGWSAAPTFFLSQHVLGVQPLQPGYEAVRIVPQPGGLEWAHGRVPTPHGSVVVYWKQEDGAFFLDATLPGRAPARLELPGSGPVETYQGATREVARGDGRVILVCQGERIVVKVKASP